MLRLPRLKALDLEGLAYNHMTPEVISSTIVKCCPGLRDLGLSRACPAAIKLIDELELERLLLVDTFVGFDGWRPHHSARSLGFDCCSGLKDSNVSLICSMPNLERLFFCSCNEFTGAGLRCGTALKALHLNECEGLTDEGLGAVPGSSHLTCLSLYFGARADEDADGYRPASSQSFAAFAASFPLLEHLSLEGPELFEERQLRLIERNCRALTNFVPIRWQDRERFLALFPLLASVAPKMPCHHPPPPLPPPALPPPMSV